MLEDLRTDVRVGDRAGDTYDDDDYDDDYDYFDYNDHEGGNGEEGRAIAADETMENLNQDAETGNQAKDRGDSINGGKKLQVQDPVTLQRSYTCGRCSGSIDLDSTFYRCVGHSCRGMLTH